MAKQTKNETLIRPVLCRNRILIPAIDDHIHLGGKSSSPATTRQLADGEIASGQMTRRIKYFYFTDSGAAAYGVASRAGPLSTTSLYVATSLAGAAAFRDVIRLEPGETRELCGGKVNTTVPYLMQRNKNGTHTLWRCYISSATDLDATMRRATEHVRTIEADARLSKLSRSGILGLAILCPTHQRMLATT